MSSPEGGRRFTLNLGWKDNNISARPAPRMKPFRKSGMSQNRVIRLGDMEMSKPIGIILLFQNSLFMRDNFPKYATSRSKFQAFYTKTLFPGAKPTVSPYPDL